MTLKTSSRQNLAAAIATIKLADMPAGTPVDVFTKLPNGVIPVALTAVVVTPLDTAGTSPTEVLDIGNADGGAEYANDINLMAAAGTRTNATTLPVIVNETAGGLQLTVTRVQGGTGLTQPTQGEVMLILQFAQDGVEHFSHG